MKEKLPIQNDDWENEVAVSFNAAARRARRPEQGGNGLKLRFCKLVMGVVGEVMKERRRREREVD